MVIHLDPVSGIAEDLVCFSGRNNDGMETFIPLEH
jgi:hypothetical protein